MKACRGQYQRMAFNQQLNGQWSKYFIFSLLEIAIDISIKEHT